MKDDKYFDGIRDYEYEIPDEFDYVQYKKDIEMLNALTERILKNNPSCVKKIRDPKIPVYTKDNETSSFPKKFTVQLDDMISDITLNKVETDANEVMRKICTPNIKRRFGDNWVGENLSKEIMEKSKEIIPGNDLPPIAKSLQDLGLYGVYAVNDNKFDAVYMDFVIEESVETELTDKNIFSNPNMTSFKYPKWNEKWTEAQKAIDDTLNEEAKMKTIGLKLFNTGGRMTPRFIPFSADSRLEIAIKDFINDEFVKKVKNLADLTTDEKIVNHLRPPIILENGYVPKDVYSKICNRITMISNYIATKCRRGPATFIYTSKRNVDFLIEAFSGYWWKDGKTYKYNRTPGGSFNYNLIANDDLGDTVIVGRLPKEGEPGINLVINRNTLTDYEYSDDDIAGVNLSFDFFDFGLHPEDNYFSFEMKR